MAAQEIQRCWELQCSCWLLRQGHIMHQQRVFKLCLHETLNLLQPPIVKTRKKSPWPDVWDGTFWHMLNERRQTKHLKRQNQNYADLFASMEKGGRCKGNAANPPRDGHTARKKSILKKHNASLAGLWSTSSRQCCKFEPHNKHILVWTIPIILYTISVSTASIFLKVLKQWHCLSTMHVQTITKCWSRAICRGQD